MSNHRRTRISPTLFTKLAIAGVAMLVSQACVVAVNDRPNDTMGGDDSQGTADEGTTGLVNEDPTLAWGPCPRGFAHECRNMPVPLDWQQPEGRTIELLVSRVAPAQGTARQQLWLIAGGPGDSGEIFAGSGFYELLPTLLPETEVFVLEHRGVGHSSRLGCSAESPDSEAGVTISPNELPGCLEQLRAEWGDDLRHFNSRSATLDVAHALAQHARPGVSRVVAGFSYGTFLSQRLLQLAPEQVDAVILDSVLPARGMNIADYDGFTDRVFVDWAQLCREDDLCRNHMGDDPAAQTAELMQRLDAGHCPELGLSSAALASIGASLLTHRLLRTHLFPLLYRLDRCDTEDVAVIGGYAQRVGEVMEAAPTTTPLSSTLLGYNIIAAESYDPQGATVAEAQAACEAAIFCRGTSVEMMTVAEHWPRYQADSELGQWPEVETPILSLNGDLDPQTPHREAREVRDRYTGTFQHYIELPGAPHIVVMNSPVGQESPVHCGMSLLAQFVQNPRAPVDTGCLQQMQPIDFSPSDPLTQQLFGTADIWGHAKTE